MACQIDKSIFAFYPLAVLSTETSKKVLDEVCTVAVRREGGMDNVTVLLNEQAAKVLKSMSNPMSRPVSKIVEIGHVTGPDGRANVDEQELDTKAGRTIALNNAFIQEITDDTNPTLI